jgi:beta-glucosidase
VSAPVDELEPALERVADAAPNARALVVTGDPAEGDDERRADRLGGAAGAVTAAHGGGLQIVGAFHQPAIDGYEWHRGFTARLGLFDRDRNPRPTLAAWRAPG